MRGDSILSRQNDDFIMLPTVDFCFKELMNNAKVRKGFVAAILGKDPKEIHETILLPTDTRKRSKDDKQGFLDVKVLLVDGTKMDMEMQVEYFEYWDKRILFYLAKMYTDQLKKGESYEKLKKCIHVSILDFNHFPNDEKYYRVIKLCDKESGETYSDLFELHILELKKLPPEAQNEEAIIQWMRFFSRTKKEEFENMAKLNEYLDEAYNELLELSADDMKRLEYEAREKALRDYNSQMQSALKRGEVRGQAIGEVRGIQLAKKVFQLYNCGVSEEEIAKQCKITVNQVKEILE